MWTTQMDILNFDIFSLWLCTFCLTYKDCYGNNFFILKPERIFKSPMLKAVIYQMFMSKLIFWFSYYVLEKRYLLQGMCWKVID